MNVTTRCMVFVTGQMCCAIIHVRNFESVKNQIVANVINVIRTSEHNMQRTCTGYLFINVYSE